MNARTCIICGEATGSREHIFPAALGGRRTNKGIYCGHHNGAYSGLAGIIADQLSIFNALLGVVGDHATDPTSTTMTDVESGQEIVLNNKRTRFRVPQILSEKTEGDERVAEISFNSREEANNWVRKQQAKGIDAELVGKGERKRYYLGTAHKQFMFGGDQEGLRAIGYIAQTFLAHALPDIARLPELQGMKDYTLNNVGKGFVWWDFEPPLNLPPNNFPFGHRVIVGLNHKDNSIYARISFFSTLNFAVLLGSVPLDASRAVITDIDPLAKSPPNDIVTWTEETAFGAVSKPDNPSAGLADAIETGRAKERIIDLMRRITDYERRTAAANIMQRIASANPSAGPMSDALFAGIVSTESQRVFNLISYVANDLRARASNVGERAFASFMDGASALDPKAANGLSDEATQSLSIASEALAKQMREDWQNGKLDLDRVEMLIGGGPGAAVVGSALAEKFELLFPE